MKTSVTPASWIVENGFRLDPLAFASGAIAARKLVESRRFERLSDLTSGFKGGIFTHLFSPKRTYVDQPKYGVPFLGASSMRLAELTQVRLLSARDANSRSYSPLRIREGMTLISCSGSVGDVVFARAEMDGMSSAGDILKIQPNPHRIPPGYLYAYLSGQYGKILVGSGTYGSIVQHIESQHVAQLPVPRFSTAFEARVDKLVRTAGDALTKRRELLEAASNRILEEANLPALNDAEMARDSRTIGWSQLIGGSESFRSLNFDPRTTEVFALVRKREHHDLGALCERAHFKGKIIFKRIDASGEYGVPLLGQRTAFHFRPEGRVIARKSIEGLGLQVPRGTILIPSHGTMGRFELYCRALFVTEGLSRFAFSGDFFRCIPISSLIRPGYLFAYLRSRTAFWMLRAISCGSKQQEQHPLFMARFPVPRLADAVEAEIASEVDEAGRLYDLASSSEEEARRLVDSAIEEGP